MFSAQLSQDNLAEENWTKIKLKRLGISKYFDNNFHVVDARGPKAAKDWQEAIAKFGNTPNQVMVVGDSKRSDIRPAHEAGVDKVVWLDLGYGWIVYLAGDLPEGTMVIKNIGDLPTAIRGIGYLLQNFPKFNPEV